MLDHVANPYAVLWCVGGSQGIVLVVGVYLLARAWWEKKRR